MTVRHGQGYTRYTHDSRHLYQDLLGFVATDDSIKLVCLKVRNDADRPRRLSATYYAEWVLGTVRENVPLQGFRLRGGTLRFEPCVPPRWPGFELSYRHRSATYRILVDNSAGMGRGVKSVELDGQPLSDGNVPLGDDGKIHNVRVRLG